MVGAGSGVTVGGGGEFAGSLGRAGGARGAAASAVGAGGGVALGSSGKVGPLSVAVGSGMGVCVGGMAVGRGVNVGGCCPRGVGLGGGDCSGTMARTKLQLLRSAVQNSNAVTRVTLRMDMSRQCANTYAVYRVRG